jgi:hypothetical protein
MGSGLRALKIAVIVMGVLIVGGTIALIGEVVRRSIAPAAPFGAGLPAVVEAVLQEPPGTRIAGIGMLADRLAVQLQGGGVDRIVLIDPRSGAVVGRISLAH